MFSTQDRRVRLVRNLDVGQQYYVIAVMMVNYMLYIIDNQGFRDRFLREVGLPIGLCSCRNYVGDAPLKFDRPIFSEMTTDLVNWRSLVVSAEDVLDVIDKYTVEHVQYLGILSAVSRVVEVLHNVDVTTFRVNNYYRVL